MKYAIDGSNVLLGLRLNKKPSLRLFARLLHALRERGTEFQLFFDKSIESHIAREGLTTEWNAFRGALTVAGINPTFDPRADKPIQKFCRTHGAWVINFNDKIDSWNNPKPKIHRARVRPSGNTLQLALKDGATSAPVFHVSAHEPFDFGGLHFPALNMQTAVLEPLIAPDRQYSKNPPARGTLLVLALDASISMSQTTSYDGRPKSDHLNEVVKLAITRFRNSRIEEGMYVAILRFENDVTPMLCSTGTIFASVNDWFATLGTFDYLQGVTMGQTNIRLALQRSKELIQDTLADSDSINVLADRWGAAVVLITDGNHYVERDDGTYETDTDVALEALDIHQGVSGLQDVRLIGDRIDVGCVGIGADVNRNLLAHIASPCSPKQRVMAKHALIEKLLLGDRLFIAVDSKSDKFGEAIRAFIDVASGSY